MHGIDLIYARGRRAERLAWRSKIAIEAAGACPSGGHECRLPMRVMFTAEEPGRRRLSPQLPIFSGCGHQVMVWMSCSVVHSPAST
jgi:hypothetical protein